MIKEKKSSFLHLFFLIPYLFLLSCSSSKDESPKGGNTKPKQGPVPVNVMVVTPQKMQNTVRSSGTIQAFESVDLTAETAGRIQKIYFNEGGQVSKGQLLIKINDDDLQAQLQKSNSQVQLLSQQEQRQKQLLAINAASQQDYDMALNQLNAANADKESLLAAIRKTEIRAPFNGKIGLRYISEGSYVTAQTRIASIQNINPLKVDFSIPEKYAGMVQVNDPVLLTTDESGQQITGKVYAIEPKIDEGTRSLKIRALAANASEKILPGSFTNVDLQLKEVTDAILIPTQAIVPVLKGHSVFIVENGKAKSIIVKIGVRQPDNVQITQGLAAGDTVIVTGIQQIRNDVAVTAKVK